MTGGTDWVAIFTDGTTDKVTVYEEFSTKLDNPTRTTQDLLSAVAGVLNATHTNVQFTRALAPTTNSANTYTINPKKTTSVTWAIGGTQQYIIHASAGALILNIATGQITDAPTTNYDSIYDPTIAFVIIIIGFGFLFMHPYMRSYNSIGRILNMYRPFSSKFYRLEIIDKLNIFTIDFFRTISELLLIEWLFVFAVFLWCMILFIVGMNEYGRIGLNKALIWSHLGSFCFAFTLLPITRHSIFAPIFASSFERLLKVHRWLGRMTFLFIWIHFLTMYAQFGYQRVWENLPLKYGSSVYSGTLSFISLNIMVLFSLTFIRRKYFEVFYYTHIATYVVAICGGVIHSLHFRYYVVVPIILWIIDRICRAYRSHFRNATVLSAKVHISPDTSTVTELEIQVYNLTYKPGKLYTLF